MIDLGPEGGEAGGEIVAEGTPEQIAQVAGSYTGKFLATSPGATEWHRPNGRAGRAG